MRVMISDSDRAPLNSICHHIYEKGIWPMAFIITVLAL
jgi:hypothetical protein